MLDLDSRLHWVEADPIHVTMIVEELVSNGLKYGRSSSEVRVTAVLESDEFAVVSVADQGIGISPEDQSHIFEDFFRPEWREEPVRADSIGMGLSVVHTLVEAYTAVSGLKQCPIRAQPSLSFCHCTSPGSRMF
ncbi:MAG: ATP-binding protein [Anaerolineae bacterium]|nr:ATP-binding protein [Anaerolineae bacterium]